MSEEKKNQERRYWTKDEIALLTKMKNEGHTNREIGKLVNRTASNVYLKAKSLGLRSIKKWTAEKEAKIENLISQGYGVCDLARYFGKSRKTIRLKLKKLGLLTIASERDLEQDKIIQSGQRKCFICNNIFPNTEEFFYQKRKCKNCVKQRTQKSRLNLHSNSDLDAILRNKLSSCVFRHKRYKVGLNIDLDFLKELYHKQNGLCYYTGTKLGLSIGFKDCVSIDRVDSNKGYLKSNVVLCRKDVNLMKLEMTSDEFVSLCGLVCNHSAISK